MARPSIPLPTLAIARLLVRIPSPSKLTCWTFTPSTSLRRAGLRSRSCSSGARRSSSHRLKHYASRSERMYGERKDTSRCKNPEHSEGSLSPGVQLAKERHQFKEATITILRILVAIGFPRYARDE